MDADKNNDRLFLNPRIDVDERNEFEHHILDAKQGGMKLDKSKLIRAFVTKFNDDPSKMLKYIGLK